MSAYTRAQASEEMSAHPTDQPPSPTQQKENTLNEALTFLTNLDATTSLRGNVQLGLAVDSVVKVAMSDGLNPDQLMTLLAFITSPNLKGVQTVRSKLVKCLIPSHKVPQAAAVKIVYTIVANSIAGHTNLHSLLLRWLLVVFDQLDGYEKFHRLYGLIFMFIDSARLLPHTCQLLFLLTRKEDVTLFRVQKLLDLVRMQGPEPCIMGLLMIYKVYCPHMVTIRLTYGTKAFFKKEDVVWRETIQGVAAQRKERDGEEAGEDVRRAQKRRQTAQRRMVKREKLMVPDVHAAMQELEEEPDLSEDFHPAQPARVPFVQIDTFTSFLENIDNIEYPSQVSTVLQDSQLQLLMMCDPDPVVMTRLSLWIQHVFAFGFKKTDEESKQNEDLLNLLLHFSQHVQELPVLESFLCTYLPTWDGQKYASVMFCLISCLSPMSLKFEGDSSEILRSLLCLFYSSDIYFKAGLASSLTNLLRNWASKYLKLVKSQSARTTRDQTNTSSSADEDQAFRSATEREGKETEHLAELKQQVIHLIYCLDTALVLGLRLEQDHLLLQEVARQFVEMTSVLFTKYSVPMTCFPTKAFYRLLLSDSPATLAALCDSVIQFRTSIKALRMSPYPQPPGQPAAFNSVLLDVMGMLWQGRSAGQRRRLSSSMSLDFPIPSHIEPNLCLRNLTIFQGPAFLGLAYKFLSEAQGTEKKTHPSQIEKHKELYLQFLEREGFPEFRELVDVLIKNRKSSVPIEDVAV